MTTRPSPGAVQGMLPFLTTHWGSPSAPHLKGQEVLNQIEVSLKAIYALLGCREEDTIIFTSSGAESISHAIFSTYHTVSRSTGKNQFLTSLCDEAPVIMALSHLEQMGCTTKLISPNSSGIIDVSAVVNAISPRTAMLSLSWACGLTGSIHSIEEIASLCRERGIVFHVDITHVLGKISYNFADIGADFMSFNGEQLHAPKGTGGLYVRRGVSCVPLIFGGLEQAGLRGGSYNIPVLVALGIAAQEAVDNCDLMGTEVARLRNKLEEGIMASYPGSKALFKDQRRLPHCTTVLFPGVANESLLYALNRKMVCANIGGGSFQQIALLLKAYGIDDVLAHTGVSFSLSRETTEEEIDAAIEIVAAAAHKLRKLNVV